MTISTTPTAWIRKAMREQREALEMSQADLAARFGLASCNFVSMLETGRSPMPLRRAADIADFIGASPWAVIRSIMLEQGGLGLECHLPAA